MCHFLGLGSINFDRCNAAEFHIKPVERFSRPAKKNNSSGGSIHQMNLMTGVKNLTCGWTQAANKRIHTA
jgi:hypothetical protein